MSMDDYFSIDDILSSEPRLHCTFRVRGHNLGHLDPVGVQAALDTSDLPIPDPASDPASADDDDAAAHIPQNHKLALPFWLAETLSERNLVTLHMPHCFKRTVHNQLRADAPAVSLHALCPSYYALGVRLAKLVRDLTLPAILVRAFANRCWRIVDNAAFTPAHAMQALAKLDLLERNLFFTAHAVTNAIVRWKERSCDRIVSYASVLGKRPFVDHDEEEDQKQQAVVGSPVTPPTSRVRVY